MQKTFYFILFFSLSLGFNSCELFFDSGNDYSYNDVHSNDPINNPSDPANNNNGGWSNGNNSGGNTGGDKIADYLPTQALGDQLVQHQFYSASYSTKHKNPEWVAYELTSSRLRSPEVERRGSFKSDPAFSGEAKSSDYTKSGYDRGHLAPAHDMNFSEKAMEESFYMTNVSPQNPDFNRGIWKKLENRVREWGEKEGRLYIVTGPILRKRLSSRTEKIGNDVSVPREFYKVILDYQSPQKKGIAFIFDNEASDKPLYRFAVSIDEVEERTDIDFFPKLPKSEQQVLEGNVDVQAWADLMEE